jgi:hypothetical protein
MAVEIEYIRNGGIRKKLNEGKQMTREKSIETDFEDAVLSRVLVIRLDCVHDSISHHCVAAVFRLHVRLPAS